MNDLEFLEALGLDETNLPRVPRVPLKNSGQPEANKDAVPRVPRAAPGENKGKESENDSSPAPGEGGGQEIESAYTLGFRSCWHMLFNAGVLVHGAQQAGQECNGCQHLIMTIERHSGSRRKFFWRCGLGYRQLETGHGGERIIIAPPECQSWERWQPGSTSYRG